MATYRAGIVGLGWMGWLYDVATRPSTALGPSGTPAGLPPLRADRDPPPMAHPGKEGLTSTYAGALVAHPQTELVAACEPDEERLAAFGRRYGVTALYADYRHMLEIERLDFVAVATRTDIRPDVTCLAVACGARGVTTEKPMAHTLAEADRMVEVCAQAGVPLSCGAISVNHPAFVRAKALLDGGMLGRILSLETSSAAAQHNGWLYLIDSPAAWVFGVAADEEAVRANREFTGAGVIQFGSGAPGFLRPGAPFVRITCERGELTFDWRRFRLWLDVESPGGTSRVEVPFAEPQLLGEWSPLYGVDDVLQCIERGGEPRVSGRRVRDAMEIEIGLRESHRQGNVKLPLPLANRSLGLVYAWFR